MLAIDEPGPDEATVVDRLVHHADRTPERVAFRFVPGRGEAEVWTFGQLREAVARRAAAVRAACAPGEPVLVLEPSGLDYIASFLGVLAAGATAVPLLPPRSARNVERLEQVVRGSGARFGFAPPTVRTRFANAGLGLDPTWLESADLDPLDARPDPDAVALLQFTSGSTGAPKGVVLRHRHLTANVRQIHAAFPFQDGLTWVGWLPLQHDMGLVGTVLAPVFAGQTSTLMAPETFLMRPARWLEAISLYGANISGGPDFGFATCVDRIDDAALSGLDLSRWRVAFTGAEPVRPATLERFATRFAAAGFDRRALYPCYGLAEATLFVAGPPPDRGPVVRRFDPVALAEGWLRPREEGRPLVGHGAARPGQAVAIVEGGQRQPSGRVGEIWVRGPNVGSGYHRREDDGTFGARLDGVAGWLRTGDLGAVFDGELFVTGRIKDLILCGGHNVYPQDLEQAVEASDPRFAPGGTAAFSIDDGARERVVVAAELRREALRDRAAWSELPGRARAAVFEREGVELSELVLLRPGGLPRTTSGKPRRSACRDAHQSGSLNRIDREVAQ